MKNWRKLTLLALLILLLSSSLWIYACNKKSPPEEYNTNKKPESAKDDSSTTKQDTVSTEPNQVPVMPSGQAQQGNSSWILYLLILLAFGATAGLIWFFFNKCKLLLRDEADNLALKIKALKEPPPENPQYGKAANEKSEKSIQGLVVNSDKELSSIKAEISDLKVKLEELRRSLDPDYLSLKISELIESNLTKNLQQFRSSLDKLGPELKNLMLQRDQNQFISPVPAVSEQYRRRPEPPLQSSQPDYVSRINQDFQSWLPANSLNQHFIKEYKQNGLTYLGIAPRRNTGPFQGLDPEFKAYTNDDFYEIRTEPGMNAGHVKAVEQPAIIMIKDGIRETKQKGCYTQVRRG